MKRFALLIFFLMTLMLVLFIFAETLNIPFLSEENYPQQQANGLSGLMNTGLLVVDVVLPVPSSLVMIVNGALFGIIGGATLSFMGGIGASLLGYFLGRANLPWLMRFLSEADLDRARKFMARWGGLALIVSRPIPILAETMCIIAGTSGLSLLTTAYSVTLGLLPIVFLYAYVGATASNLDSGLLAFVFVIIAASLTWFIRLWFKRNQA